MDQEFSPSLLFNEIESQDLIFVISNKNDTFLIPEGFPKPSEIMLQDLQNQGYLVFYPETQFAYKRIFFLKINLEEDPLKFPPQYKISQILLAFQELGVEIFKLSKSYKMKTASIIFQESDLDQFKKYAFVTFGSIYLLKYPYKKCQHQQQSDYCNQIGLINKIEQSQQQLILRKLEVYKCSLRARLLTNSRAQPLELVSIASSFQTANQEKVQIQVIQGEELKQQGYNLIYSVGQGSLEPPAIVHLQFYNNPSSSLKISIVGKVSFKLQGITFDAGGLNIKMSYLNKMFIDKAGASTVLQVFQSAVLLNLPLNLTATLAIAQNAVDAKSYLPGSIIQSKNGKTVEITNTDSEGRLVLADAFTYVQEKEKPNIMIDIATLTIGVVNAFGWNYAGVLGNDEDLIKQLQTSGEEVNELFMNLPVLPEHFDAHRGNQSDLINSSSSSNSKCQQATAFL